MRLPGWCMLCHRPRTVETRFPGGTVYGVCDECQEGLDNEVKGE